MNTCDMETGTSTVLGGMATGNFDTFVAASANRTITIAPTRMGLTGNSGMGVSTSTAICSDAGGFED